MNYPLIAVVLFVLLGIAHSALGEYLIFRHLRIDGRWIDTSLNGLRIRQIRALWSTWHLLTLFGWSLGGILLFNGRLSFPADQNLQALQIKILLATFITATIFWIIGTKAKHPGWVVFLLISLLIWFSL